MYTYVYMYFFILVGRGPTLLVPPIFTDDLIKESRRKEGWMDGWKEGRKGRNAV